MDDAREWGVNHRFAVPRWITPLALANFALFVVFILDHQSTYHHPLLVLVDTGSLVALFAALFAALVHRDGSPPLTGQRVPALPPLGALPANTPITRIPVPP